jgi:hypothetical protein
MNLLTSVNFGPADITAVYTVGTYTLPRNVPWLCVAVHLRGLDAANATREVRILMDSVTINGVSTNDVWQNDSDRFFEHTGASAAHSMRVVIPAGAKNHVLDIRLLSSNTLDTAVHGTVEVWDLSPWSEDASAGDFTGNMMGNWMRRLHAIVYGKRKQTIATGVVVARNEADTADLVTLTPSVDNADAPTVNILTPS